MQAELGKLSSLQPDKGKVAIHVDCSPTAAPMFEGRGGEELSTELSVALQHCLLDAKSLKVELSRELTVNRKGHICGLTKRGGAGLDPSVILDMMSVVEHVSEQLINKLDSEIAAAEAGEEES
uniref:Uncharacterized protein n=1 Tax=Quercus lobata TaxID=97700 RepID=A0A7N2L322_QUELO